MSTIHVQTPLAKGTFVPSSPVSRLSTLSLANVLDQSTDCVKLVGVDGTVQYMNGNGLCAMEIDDFRAIDGAVWVNLWPEAARSDILASYIEAAGGQTARFRAYCPTTKGSPRWWDVSVSGVNDSADQLVGFLAVSRDVTSNQLSREALMIAAEELKHRLKNTYQTIASLLMLTARGNADNEKFAWQMAVRLGAVSRAQTLFADNDAPCNLAELIPALVTPFSSELVKITFDSLPTVRIEQSQADAIALVVGELSVNASKYGALAHGGSIEIEAVQSDQRLTIVWRERCARAFQHCAPNGGQGMSLMTRVMNTRGGDLTVDWVEQGLNATMAIQLSPS
jgi:two-component sensor histidine kinase